MSEANRIKITSSKSLIHIGSLDSFDITEGGKAAARAILAYFDTGNEDCLKRAIDIYTEIIPNENFGGEYTALQWICRLILAPPKQRNAFLSHPIVESWYEYLSGDGFKELKEYISLKYHFAEIAANDGETRHNLRFLEDFILFNNPDRERWENTGQSLSSLLVNKGDKIADIGCGPGYYSFKFADMVGEAGKVYSIETNPLHIKYLRNYIHRYGITNVEIVNNNTEGIGLDPSVKVNLVYMCSLYHVLYAALTESERGLFMKSIRHCLVDGGQLVIVDNNLVEDELPYHGPYIAKELIISQMLFYGFELEASRQFTPQRYMLVFKKLENMPLWDDTRSQYQNDSSSGYQNGSFTINSGASLVNYRIADAAPTAGFTSGGQEAARLFFDALIEKTEQAVQKALRAYDELIPLERIGDEYTAFVWFCQYLAADEDKRYDMLSDSLTREYFDYLGAEDFKLLKQYLKVKYELEKPVGVMENLNQVTEYITFNNPNRDSWERTNEMLAYLDVKKGESIADVGCGSGFFTYKFALAAGSGGTIYATEINRDALSYVENFKDKYDMNIITVVNGLNDLCLPENSVDTVFMCSMYHAVYIASIEFVKDDFINSVKKALRKGGRLVIVDNETERSDAPPYFGSAIAKELVIAQLNHYGFRLKDCKHFIPQRYVMVFEMVEQIV